MRTLIAERIAGVVTVELAESQQAGGAAQQAYTVNRRWVLTL